MSYLVEPYFSHSFYRSSMPRIFSGDLFPRSVNQCKGFMAKKIPPLFCCGKELEK